MRFGEVLKNSFTLWLKDKKSLIYVLALIGLFAVLAAGLIAFLAIGSLTNSIRFIEGSDLTQVALSDDGNIIFLAIAAIVLLCAFIVFFVGTFYVSALLEVRALQLLGFNTARFGLIKFVKLVLFQIWVSIMAYTSWYNKAFFYYLIGLILFWVTSIGVFLLIERIGNILLLLATLLSAVYLLPVIYNTIRLSIASAIYLHEDFGIMRAGRDAWELAHKKVLGIFIAFLLVQIAIQILLIIPWFVLIIAANVALLLTGIELLAIAIAFTGMALIIIFAIVVSSFAVPSIYSEVKNSPSEQPPAPSGLPKNTTALTTMQTNEPIERMRASIQRQEPVYSQPQRQQSYARRSPAAAGLSAVEKAHVNKLAAVLKDVSHRYKESEIRQVIKEKNYSDRIADETIKLLQKDLKNSK